MPNGERLEVLTTRDSGTWMDVLEQIGDFDFYHLPSYHVLAELQGEGRGIVAVCREAGHTVAFPMLVRDIHEPLSMPGEELRDITSVYGYAGPVASSPLPEGVRLNFLNALDGFLRSQGIVVAFSRLHPLLRQSSLLEGYGEIRENGVTTSIDLTLPPEEQVSCYRKSHRYEIQRLRKMGFTCFEVGEDYLHDFIRIYHESMRALDAEPYYYFDRPYFEYLIEGMSDVMHLFICTDGRTVACAALFAVCNWTVQYHLAGTSVEYRKLAPMKLLIDTVREWSMRIGAKTLHLGGGLGGRRDSLFEFKRGFATNEHSYSTWRCIIDPAAYERLNRRAWGGGEEWRSSGYFPAYRDPACDAISLRNSDTHSRHSEPGEESGAPEPDPSLSFRMTK